MNYFRSLLTNPMNGGDVGQPTWPRQLRRQAGKAARKALPKEFRPEVEESRSEAQGTIRQDRRDAPTLTKRSIGIARDASIRGRSNMEELSHFLRTTGPKRDRFDSVWRKAPPVDPSPVAPPVIVLTTPEIPSSSSLNDVNKATEDLMGVVTSMMRQSSGSYLTMRSQYNDGKEESIVEEDMWEFQYMAPMLASSPEANDTDALHTVSPVLGSPKSDQNTLRQSLDDKPLPIIPISEYMNSPRTTLFEIEGTVTINGSRASSLHNHSGSVEFRLPTRTVPRPKATNCTSGRGEAKEKADYAQWYHTSTARAKEKLMRKRKERQPISRALITMFGDGTAQDATELGERTA
ncbi:hypothetical protein FRB94_003416 [Tulasnella sp. JGI-2019a]|nr:hypothetical protein FRB93_012043 [Tulasnella sp. JGI-2019a]KAG9003053.1 hypothetical protein FRB94_003416 [Tulasnella sp. JGI-2019a]KAG9035399.1 hypothetical protein FRB95_011419 [Tulasnella sp. JGI-2019a]